MLTWQTSPRRVTSHTHVQLSNSKAYITIRNAKAVKDTHTVTRTHTHSSYEQQSALTSHFSHCQDWKYQLLTLRRDSPNTPQPHPGFQEEQRRTQASDQWSWLECVQRRSVEVHKLGRRRATNSLSNVSPVQCSAVFPVPKLLHGLPGCIHKAVDCRFLMQN